MGRKTPAIVAAAQQRSPQFEKMLNSANINHRTPTNDAELPKDSSLLHIAVSQRHEGRVELLLRKSIDVNIRNVRGDTALVHALRSRAVVEDPIVAALLDAPAADLDLQNNVRCLLHVDCVLS